MCCSRSSRPCSTRRLMDRQSVTGVDDSRALRPAQSSAAQRRLEQSRAESGPDVDYMAAMQCKPPTLLAAPSPRPPPLQYHHHQNRNAGRHTFDPAVRKACVGSGPITKSLASPCPLTPALGVAHPVPVPVPTHKKWHHFLDKRDERLPLLHIGPCYHARQSRYYRQYSDLSCSLSRLPDWALGPMARCSAIVPILSIRHEPPRLPLGRWSPPRGWLLVGGQSDSMCCDTVPWVICLCPVLLSNVSKHRLGPSLSCRRHPPPRASGHVLRCHPPPPGPISSIWSICPPQPLREITHSTAHHTRETTGGPAWGRWTTHTEERAALGSYSRGQAVSGRAQTAMLPRARAQKSLRSPPDLNATCLPATAPQQSAAEH